jgi:hypothetical protein
MKNKVKNYSYRFYINYLRRYIRITSFPFISGDTFRKMAQHKLDELSTINTDLIKKNDIVFVKTDFLDYFFEDIYPKLDEFFILLSHNSDIEISNSWLDKMGDKDFKWFAQNLNFSNITDSRVDILPIGLENRSYFRYGKTSNFKYAVNQQHIKINRIYCSFNLLTNSKRVHVQKLAKNNDNVDFNNFANHKSYLNNLSKYKFSLCPQGNGIDTHRFWESLAVGTIPIVERSHFSDNFQKLGVPIYVLDSWDELEILNSEQLSEFYSKKSLNLKDFVSYEFWERYINSHSQ